MEGGGIFLFLDTGRNLQSRTPPNMAAKGCYEGKMFILGAYAVLSSCRRRFLSHFLTLLHKNLFCLIKNKCLRKVADKLHRVVT